MKINWKIRFKNKVWLTSFVGVIIGFIYQMLSMFGIVPVISEDNLLELLGMLITLLAGLGIIVDPTTKGVSDSDRAMTYGKDDK